MVIARKKTGHGREKNLERAMGIEPKAHYIKLRTYNAERKNCERID